MEVPTRLNVEDFNASEDIGFELREPLEFLPPSFQIWNDLGKGMPALVEKKDFRDHVLKMPTLDYNQLTYKQLRLAHVQLGNIAAGYVWQNGDTNVPKVLPSCVAVPLWEISQKIGLPAAICHAAMVGANYAKINTDGPMEAELVRNLRCIYPTPGGHEVEWLVQVSVEMGAHVGPSLKGIADAMYCADTTYEDGLIAALEEVSQAMHRITQSLAKLHVRTTPKNIYTVSRPFLFGYVTITRKKETLDKSGHEDKFVHDAKSGRGTGG